MWIESEGRGRPAVGWGGEDGRLGAAGQCAVGSDPRPPDLPVIPLIRPGILRLDRNA